MTLGVAYDVGAVGVTGGRTGSLELLDADEITTEDGRVISVPDGSQDVVIQNPPYSRARHGRGVFTLNGMTDADRKRSAKRLSDLVVKLKRRGNLMPHGQAGMASHFSALADIKLKIGGVFGSVLPLTAAHSESWSGFREHMATNYSNVIAITHPTSAQSDFSADTGINEMLIIGTKRQPGEAQPITSVNLSIQPKGNVQAIVLAIRNIPSDGTDGAVDARRHAVRDVVTITIAASRLPVVAHWD